MRVSRASPRHPSGLSVNEGRGKEGRWGSHDEGTWKRRKRRTGEGGREVRLWGEVRRREVRDISDGDK